MRESEGVGIGMNLTLNHFLNKKEKKKSKCVQEWALVSMVMIFGFDSYF